jgi:hypothetical protein
LGVGLLRIEKYSAEKKDAWNCLIKDSKNGTFMFDRNYMDYHADRFEDFSLMFFEDQNLIAVLPGNVENNTLFSHQGLTFGGMIYDCNMKSPKMLEIFTLMIEFLKSQKIEKLIYKAIPHIYHSLPAEEDLYALFRVGAKLFRRDLSTTIYQPEKMRFERGRRRCVEDAKKAGLVIKRSYDFDDLYEIIKNILEKKYATKPVHSAAEMKLLHDRFLENIHLYGCYDGEKMVSGSLIFITKKTIHAQYVYSSDEGKKMGANDLMYDFLINEKFTNFEYFDFGISTENDGFLLNQNLIQQKEMFGGRAIAYDFYELNLK